MHMPQQHKRQAPLQQHLIDEQHQPQKNPLIIRTSARPTRFESLRNLLLRRPSTSLSPIRDHSVDKENLSSRRRRRTTTRIMATTRRRNTTHRDGIGRDPNRMSLLIDYGGGGGYHQLDDEPEDIISKTVNNNASNNGVLSHLGGYNMDTLVTLQNQVVSVGDFMKQAATAPCKMQLVWGDSETLLMLQMNKKKRSRNKGTTTTTNNANDSTTVVDPTWFEPGPFERLGVSGGTAPFFNLHLTPTGIDEVTALKRQQQQGVSASAINTTYFIGKDLSHAEDEREFYEKILKIQRQGEEERGVALLTPFLFDYLGVLEHEDTTTQPQPQKQQLLVMQNLRNNYNSFRMLDLKMGCQTAQGGWQGKPHLNAWRQNLLDGMTNSAQEGYRLEGFDGCGERRINITSDPIMDVLVKAYKSRTAFMGRAMTDAEIKRTTRVMLQTLGGTDIFRYFMDLHMEQPITTTTNDDQPNGADGSLDTTMVKDTYLSVEVQEIVFHELVKQLVALAVACHKNLVPQKWIGSSVALGYDAGYFPKRNGDLSEDAEDNIRNKVIVKVFDWGRSELMTQLGYASLTKSEQSDRQKFWDNYMVGVDNLAYNATRSYYHHFTNSNQWNEVTIQVMNFDTGTEIGHVTFSLPATAPTKNEIIHSGPIQLENYAETDCGSLRCSISWLVLPHDSRLKGTWRVTIQNATNLPSVGKNIPVSVVPGVGDNYFRSTNLDTYCQITTRCNNNVGGRRELIQNTKVYGSSLNPEWNETIDVPVMRTTNQLSQALKDQGLLPTLNKENAGGCSDQDLESLFPAGELDISEWTKLLQEAANRQT